MSNVNHDLMTALDFTAADLDSNRHGTITERQQAVLRDKRLRQVRSLLLWGVYMGVMALLYFFAQPDRPTTPLLSWAITVLFGIGALGYLGAATAKWRAISAELRNGAVQSVEGPVALEKKVRGGGFRRLRVGGVVFDISKAESLTFQNEAPYKVYYMPSSKIVVAVEPL